MKIIDMEAKKEKRIIPLDTFYVYYACEDGHIYREDKKLKPWRHLSVYRSPKEYYRIGLKMKNGHRQLFFVQRLMGMAFFDLLKYDKTHIMLHNSTNSLDNRKSNLRIGDTRENNTADRLSQGTYWLRGKRKRKLGEKNRKYKRCA